MRHLFAAGLAGHAAVVLLAFAAAGTAEARIKCQGNFQETKYGLLATPYCQGEQIAAVARSYGVKVSGTEVRNDALKKVRLCQRFGGDVRLKGSCGAYAPEQFR